MTTLAKHHVAFELLLIVTYIKFYETTFLTFLTCTPNLPKALVRLTQNFKLTNKPISAKNLVITYNLRDVRRLSRQDAQSIRRRIGQRHKLLHMSSSVNRENQCEGNKFFKKPITSIFRRPSIHFSISWNFWRYG